MSIVAPLVQTATVTIDAPAVSAVDPVAERAKEIIAKQQLRLVESTKLVVTAVLDALESRPAIRDSERFKLTIDDDALRAYRNREGAAEVAGYGVSPYLRDPASLELFKESVQAALGGAFGTTVVTSFRSALIIEVGVSKSDAPVETPSASRALVPAGSHDLAVTKAIANQLTTRSGELKRRRSYFSDLAKTTGMRAVAELAKARTGSRQMLMLQDDYQASVMLRGDGRVADKYRRVFGDEALLALDMEAIAEKVEKILANATSGTLPATERWRNPWNEYWHNW